MQPVGLPSVLGATRSEEDSVRTVLSAEEFESMTCDLAEPLMAAALRLTRRRADAEDLVQETLFRAWRSLRTFERGTHFRAWLFRILQNAFINRGRREAMAPAAMDPVSLEREEPPHVTPDIRELEELASVADEHFDERVKTALEKLPDAYRIPMVLFSLGNLSYQEIADAMSVPIGTVMSRLHRARAQLRGELTAYAREMRHPVEGP